MYGICGKRYEIYVEKCGIYVKNVWNLWKKIWNTCGSHETRTIPYEFHWNVEAE